MASVTVFLFEDPTASEVMAALRRWVGERLCREFIYVATPALNGAGATAQDCVVVDAEGEHADDLYRWLSEWRREVVRFVTLHVVAPNAPPADPAALVKRDVELGYQVRRLLGQDQRFVHLNLFVPSAGVDDLPTSAARLDLTANLVVAPEDRAAPGTFARPLDGLGENGPQFITHAAVNAAAVGALWHQVEEGPFDDAEQFGGGVAVVQVVRSFLRLLDGPDPVPGIISVALSPTDDSGQPTWPKPSSSNTTEAGAATPFLKIALEDALNLDSRMFDLRLPPRRRRPPQTLVTIWMAIKMFASFLWDRLRNAVPEKVAQVRNEVIRRFNRLGQSLVGDDSQLLVRFGGRLTVDDVVVPPLDTDDLVAAALEVTDLVDGLERYLAPAQAPEWDSLRTAMFALVDGSTMPEGFSTPVLGDVRPVVLDPALLTPSPEIEPLIISGVDAFLPNQGRIQLTAFDPFATDQLIHHVEGVRPSDEESTRSRQALLSRLHSWREQRRKALLWSLGSHLGSQIEAARVQLVASLLIVQRGRPRAADGDLQAEATRAFRWIAIALGVGLVLAVAATLGLPAAGLAFGLALGIALAILIGAIAAAIWRHLQFLHYEFKLRHQREQAVSDFEQAAEDVVVCSQELIRLGSLYWQYERWAECIAHLLHRPWGDVPEAEQVETALVISDPPLSCRVGTAQLDIEKLKPLAASLRFTIFVVGWLRTAFREAEGFAMGQIATDQALDRPPALLEDRLQTPNQSLDRFIEVLRRGEHWSATVANRKGDAEAEVRTRRPSEMFGPVTLASGEAYPDSAADPDADPVDGLLKELLRPPSDLAESLGTFGQSPTRAGGSLPIAAARVARPQSLASNQEYDGVVEQLLPPGWRPGALLHAVARVDASESQEPSDLTYFTRVPTTRTTTPPRQVSREEGHQEDLYEADEEDEGD